MQHLVYAYNNGTGLVVAMYGPVHVNHILNSGVLVSLDMMTDYPFNETVMIDVNSNGSLSLSLRIPSWAQKATVQVNNSSPLPASPGNTVML